MQEAFIVAMNRSAVTKAKKGGFRFTRSDDLAIAIIHGLMNKLPGLDPTLIDDVIVGCANPEGEQGLQIGRQISLRAIGKGTAGMTAVSYTHLRAHETVLDLVCRLLLEKKKTTTLTIDIRLPMIKQFKV